MFFCFVIVLFIFINVVKKYDKNVWNGRNNEEDKNYVEYCIVYCVVYCVVYFVVLIIFYFCKIC